MTRQEAAAAYYKEFEKISALPDMKNIATSNNREVEDSLGNYSSFRTRHLSKQADKMARTINKDEGYKSATTAYNDRYSILKDQIANKASTRYSASSDPSALPVVQTNNGWMNNSQPTNIGMAGMLGAATAPVKEQSSFSTDGSMYASRDDAMSGANKKMEEYNSSLSNLLGTAKPQQSGSGMAFSFGGGQYAQHDIDAMRISDPTRFIKEEQFAGFGDLSSDLTKAEGAMNDMNALGDNLNNSTGQKNITAYSALAAKLKPMVKRDSRNLEGASDGQSLISSELATANPYTETIN